MAEKKVLQIPFDINGNQMHHRYDYGTFKEYKDNYEFFTTLTFSHFMRGRSAAYAIFTSTSGVKYSMFLKDLEIVIPHLKNGTLSGTFTFCKRGQNFGVKLHNFGVKLPRLD